MSFAAAVQFAGGDAMGALSSRAPWALDLASSIARRVFELQEQRDRRLAGFVVEHLADAIERGRR